MMTPVRFVLIFLFLLDGSSVLLAQIIAPGADYSRSTQYTNGMPDDDIFIFCSPDANGNPITGSLTASPSITGPGFTFVWGLYDDVSHTYTPFYTDNGATSTVNNLASGGYNVTITNNAGQSETFITWLYVSIVDVSISLVQDPVNPGCEPFDVTGTINASGFTYWDPVDPGAAPFIIDANTTVTVCFNANHTYVSDLGFVLVGPPGCGSPGVTLIPNPNVVNNANGCCCNSGNNLTNLCFSTANTNQLTVCGSGTPLTGTYGLYNGNYPGNGGPNYPQGGISGLYGCNAAEGGWAVQIYDCIGIDVGALTHASITFSNGTSTLIYDSGAINSAINDNSCTPGTASIYVVPLTTPVNPAPQQVPNSGTLTYQLGVNGSAVTLAPGTNSFTQHIDPIPTDDEWYYLEIQDQLGCSAIDSAFFDFTGYADATIDPVNATNQLCTGNAAVQLTSVTSDGTWSGSGVSASGLFDPAVAGVGVHTITHTVPDPCGDVQTIDITVSDLTVQVTSTPSICTAENGTATATPLSGSAPYVYNWSTSPAQNTQTANGLAPGAYYVTVNDDQGCSLTTSATITLDPSNLSVTIPTVTDALCNSSCDGTATAVESGGTAPYQYQWDDPVLQQSATATGLCAGSFNVGVMDANGCLASAQTDIAEPTQVVLNAGMTVQSNCNQADGEAEVTATGGTIASDYAYSWNSSPIQNTSVATGLLPSTYTVTVTDDNMCQETADVTVTSTPGFTASIASSENALCFTDCNGEATAAYSNGAVEPVSYAWNSNPVQNSAAATGLCAADYEVTITDNVGCSSTAAISITEPNKLTTVLTASASPICIGQSSDLSATAVGGTLPYGGYLWSAAPSDPSLSVSTQNPTVSPVVTTVYTLVATDANGCESNPESVTIEVHPALDLSVIRPLFSPDTGICPYDFATIDLEASGGDGNYSYFLLPDQTSPGTLPLILQPAATTTYDFTVTDGCTTPPAFASSTITVFLLAQVDFEGNELSGCDPLTVDFTDLTEPTPIVWNWNFDDPESGTGNATEQNPFHPFSGPGLYSISLQVTTAEGCISDSVKQDYIEVYPLPVANFNVDPEKTNVLNGTVTFTDLSTGNIDIWNWDFGTGDMSDLQHPVYTYTDTGVFIVTLHVVTTDGCEGSSRHQVIIEPDFMFYVPNTFSPNDDGKNDTFRGYGEGVDWSSYSLSIYNRWGENIFMTNDIETPWKGQFKSMDVELGVYVWIISIYDLKGVQHTYRGNVNLIR